MAEIKTVCVIDENGKVKGKIPSELSEKVLKDIYYRMLLTEYLSKKAVNLVRQGKVSSFASSLGQEATQIGIGYPLKEEDWFVPAFREHGVLTLRGVPVKDILLYWGGSEKGNKIPEDVNCLPASVPVTSQYCHAAGLALASKIRGEKRATVVVCGDGGSSEGDWHESINFASIHKLPVVFIVQNNQWAISTPFKLQSNTDTVAEKAAAYGIPGTRVDGNDVVAVYSVVKKAMERAKKGDGPSLVECITYRMDDHTTADDAKRYRPPEDLEVWNEKNPVKRMRLYLTANHGWSDKQNEEYIRKSKAEVDTAVDEYEKEEKESIEDIFIHHYDSMPWNLKEQLEELKNELKTQ